MSLPHIFARLRHTVSRGRNERGAVMVLAAPALTLCIVACALGVDIGRIAVDKRNDQAVADMASLDAARAVGFILGTTDAAGYTAAAHSAAAASAARNGFVVGVDGHTITAAVGALDATTNVFTAGAGVSAVQVTTTSHIENAFLPGAHDLTARAVAHVGSPVAAFSVGSTLASLDTSKSRLDPMLQSMLGISSSLSAVSYDGMAGANVELGLLQQELLDLGYDVGTVDSLLTTEIALADLYTATAFALTTQGEHSVAGEVDDIPIAAIDSDLQVTLDELLRISSPSDSSVLDAGINVYQLVTGAAQVVNGTNFVSIPLAGVSLPGLAGVALAAHVIEPPQTAIGPVGTSASTAQIALQVSVDVALGFLLPVARVQLTYTTAHAAATLTSVVCGSSPTIGIDAKAGAVSVAGPATTTLGTMQVSASIAETATTALTFSHPTEFGPTVTKHVGVAGSGLNVGAVTVTGSGATAALAPILEALLPTTLNTLNNALNPVIRPLLAALGLDVSSADVAALGIFPDPSSCGGHPRLAQ